MMEVRRFVTSDFLQISAWAREYDAHYDIKQFPKTGFIVDGIAAFFLYSTDSSVCFLENMIANRAVDREERNRALSLLVEAIIKEASDLGFTVAYATTDNPSVVARAMRAGATVQGKQLLLTKKLTDPT